jgi:hypothetical protein
MNFPIPFYYFSSELEERFDFLFELLHCIYDDLDDLKVVLGIDQPPEPSLHFDPLQTLVDPFDPLQRIDN